MGKLFGAVHDVTSWLSSVIFLGATFLAIAYTFAPEFRRYVEVEVIGDHAFYKVGQISQSAAQKIDGIRFYSNRWDGNGFVELGERSGSTILTALDGVQRVEGEVLIARRPAGAEPIKGHASPNPSSSVIASAEDGTCYHVDEIICVYHVGRIDQPAWFPEDVGCQRFDAIKTEAEADRGTIQYINLWINGVTVSCN